MIFMEILLHGLQPVKMDLKDQEKTLLCAQVSAEAAAKEAFELGLRKMTYLWKDLVQAEKLPSELWILQALNKFNQRRDSYPT